MRSFLVVSLVCACCARSATEKFPFTPRAAVEPVVNCTSDDTCGHGFCRESKCLCDYNWATENVEQPCAYGRYSRTTALLLQIFLGGFSVGICVLGWHGAIGFYWGFFVMFCCSSFMSTVYSDSDDEELYKNLCSGCLSNLGIIAVLAVYITSIVFIAGDECMDKNGFACGA